MRKPTAVQAYCIPKILAGRDVLGLGLWVRAFACSVIVGGMDMLTQTKSLISRSHVFLVLDEADRVLDVGFEEELRVVFQSLLNLDKLLEVSANKEYFYKAYEGFKTVGTLKEQYLLHMLCPKMNDMGLRSAVIFVSTRRSCQLLSVLLEEIGHEAAALHSMKSQALRLSAIHLFKSGQAPILIPTDFASCGLDVPAVDLVINYVIPRFPRDYVHCVGRVPQELAEEGWLSALFPNMMLELIQEIEAVIEKRLESSLMKMRDDGFEEKAQDRKKQNMKTMAEKGLSDKRSEEEKIRRKQIDY
ncbi:hypothetical protein UlMin_007529 [Ulmus minor]